MRADPRNVSPKVELAREEAHYARHVKRLQRIHATINTSAPVTPPHIEFARQSMQRDRIYAERMSRILFSEIPGNGKKKRKVDTPDGNLPKWYYDIAQQQSAKFSTKRQEFVSLYGSKNTSGSASPGKVFLTQERPRRKQKEQGSGNTEMFGDVGETINLTDTKQTPRKSSRAVRREMEERAARLNSRNRKKVEPKYAKIEVKHLRPRISIAEPHRFEVARESEESLTPSSVHIGFDSPMPGPEQWSFVSECPKESVVNIEPAPEQGKLEEVVSSSSTSEEETPKKALRDMDTQYEEAEVEPPFKNQSTLVDSDSELQSVPQILALRSESNTGYSRTTYSSDSDSRKQRRRRRYRRRRRPRRRSRRRHYHRYSDGYSVDYSGSDGSYARDENGMSEYSSGDSQSSSESGSENQSDKASESSDRANGIQQGAKSENVAQQGANSEANSRSNNDRKVSTDSTSSDSSDKGGDQENPSPKKSNGNGRSGDQQSGSKDVPESEGNSVSSSSSDADDAVQNREHEPSGKDPIDGGEKVTQSTENEQAQTTKASPGQVDHESKEKTSSSCYESDSEKEKETKRTPKEAAESGSSEARIGVEAKEQGESQVQSHERSAVETGAGNEMNEHSTTLKATSAAVSADHHGSDIQTTGNVHGHQQQPMLNASQSIDDTSEKGAPVSQNERDAPHGTQSHQDNGKSSDQEHTGAATLSGHTKDTTKESEKVVASEHAANSNQRSSPSPSRDKSQGRENDSAHDNDGENTTGTGKHASKTTGRRSQKGTGTDHDESVSRHRSRESSPKRSHRSRSHHKSSGHSHSRSRHSHSHSHSTASTNTVQTVDAQTSTTGSTPTPAESEHRAAYRLRKKRFGTSMNRAESETQTPPVVGDGQVEIIPMIPCGEDDVLPLDSDLAARSEASATASQRSLASASRLHRQTFEGVNVPGTVPAINHMSTANLEQFTHIADSPLISPHMQGLRNPPTFRFASARLPDQSYSPNGSLIQFDNLVAKFLTATGKFEDDDGYDLRPATRREDDVIRATVGIPKVAPGSPLSRSGATSMRSVRVRPEPKAPNTAKTRTMEVRWLDG